MSEKKLTKEQEANLQEIKEEWQREVEQHFDGHKDGGMDDSVRLDGVRTWELAAIQQKYKKRIQDELGMDFYSESQEIKKGSRKSFSDLVLENPNGFPGIPGKK